MAIAKLSLLQVVGRSVRFHSRTGFAVALGCAAATAVITGALVVGDSLRGSLRDLTIQRLGKVETVVAPGRFFQEETIRSASLDRFTVPLILFRSAAVEVSGSGDSTRRSGAVQVIASDDDFWELGQRGVRPEAFPQDDQLVLNQSLADELNVSVGDEVTVRIPTSQAVPADSPLGSDESQTEGLPRLEVVAIVPDEGIARFSMTANQQQPFTIWMSLATVQEALDREGEVNAVLAAAGEQPGPAADVMEEGWTARVPWTLTDFGLQLEPIDIGFEDEAGQWQSTIEYWSLTSDQMLLEERNAEAIIEVFGEDNVQPVMTYLANSIDKLDDKGEVAASVSYSTITAIDPGPTLKLAEAIEPVNETAEAWKAGEPVQFDSDQPAPVVINSWTQQQLQAAVGDRLRLSYYEPESAGGVEVEQQFDAVVAGIVPITEPAEPYRRRREAVFEQPPTVFNDPNLTPTVPGVTDQDSIAEWDLPFQLERDVISREDDEYWANYRLTPKVFMPLAVGQELFGSRFGTLTGLRIRSEVGDGDAVAAEILGALDNVRFYPIPIRAQQLAASQGTTPFDGLFLALSFFVIVASLLLVALLFRLGMEQRAEEYGTMLAVGLTQSTVRGIAVLEGTLWSLIGSIVGIVAGLGYAWFILAALGGRWVGAVTVPFLQFHVTPQSLILGLLAGHAMATVTIWWTARQLGRSNVQGLLAGVIRLQQKRQRDGRHRRPVQWARWIGAVLIAVGAATGIAAFWLQGQAQAGAFVGAGMLLLSGMLLLIFVQLSAKVVHRAGERNPSAASLARMARRNGRRNPLRSTMTIGMLAVACFLIVSMSAFHLQPTEQGVGGFELIGESATPIFKDLAQRQVQQELIGPAADNLSEVEIFPLRLRPGQDASCNNLYQAAQPRVLGVTPAFVDSNASLPDDAGFAWAAVADNAAELDTPWRLLSEPARGSLDDPIPLILDQNTAMWSLQMRGGVGEVRRFRFDEDDPIYFRVVGLLAGSVLQGNLIIGETNFTGAFPELSGYQYYLIRCDRERIDEVSQILETELGDMGMDVRSSRELLAQLLAVQNTYLKTFEALGALGLLLGTFGLAVVQLRSVLERRGELALMRALGFSRRQLAGLVLLENTALLAGGLLLGTGVALFAVLPYALTSGTPLGVIEPLSMLAIVLAVGTLAGLLAVRKVLRLPLLSSLRGT